jgi:hypothetical protein
MLQVGATGLEEEEQKEEEEEEEKEEEETCYCDHNFKRDSVRVH